MWGGGNSEGVSTGGKRRKAKEQTESGGSGVARLLRVGCGGEGDEAGSPAIGDLWFVGQQP